MELMLKQRLVGAAVIIALAVVLIPMILDGAGKHLVPDIPHEPNYLKSHATNNLNAQGEDVATADKVDTQKGIVANKVISSKPNNPPVIFHKAKPSSGVAVKNRRLSMPPAHPNDGARQHTKTTVIKKRVPVKVARVGSTKVVSRNVTRRKPDPRTINSTPTRRKSVYDTIRVWSVQIASFKSPVNARVLKRKLSKAGFNAYIFQSRSKKRRQAIYRVRIGPESSHSKARAILAELRQKVRLNGYITSHK